MFVHHTASSSSYSAADVPSLIRGFYRFHVLSRGWFDIGYNYLVDRYGRIYEGRSGGITQQRARRPGGRLQHRLGRASR